MLHICCYTLLFTVLIVRTLIILYLVILASVMGIYNSSSSAGCNCSAERWDTSLTTASPLGVISGCQLTNSTYG